MSNVQGKAPLQLIRYSEGRFEVPSETAQFLRSFTRPLALVTIVGKYRTGKSLLLNKVLLKQPSFSVSPTIHSCTKGLWLSKQTLRNQQQQTDVLVVDTEGFGAPEETDQYNQKILLFAMLLSSYFIYNSVGSIDQNSLNSLNLVSQIAREILKNNSKDEKAEQEAPAFLWLLRDFALNLVDKNGTPIQPREYLEQALELQKGSSDAIEGKNKIRRMLKHFFKDRDCFTLVRPVESEQHLQSLLMLPDSSFRAEFLEQASLLRSKVLKKARAKRIKGRPLSGQLLLQLANHYVQVVNKGELPNFQLSYKQVLKVQAQRSATEFLRCCSNKLSSFAKKLLSQGEIESVKAQLFKDLQVRLKQLGLEGELKGISESTKAQIQQMTAAFKQENKRRCKESCSLVWNNLHDKDRQFQDGDEIERYFLGLLQELKAEMAVISNPVDQHYLTLLVQEHQIRSFRNFIDKSRLQYSLQLESRDQRVKELERHLSQKSNAFNRLEDSNHQLTRQIHRLNSKLLELEQVKDVEIGYLKQQSSEHSREINQLLSKLQELSTEAEQLRDSLSDSNQATDGLSRSLRQSQEDRRLIEKELEITKYTLLSKEDQNRLVKMELTETRTKLQAAMEKQSQMLSKHQDEVSLKMSEYSNLCRKNESQAEQISRLNARLANLQLQLQQNSQALGRERQIYEQMFDSLRESLKAESTSRLELIETNKNLSAAIKHLEHRSQQAQEKELILKDFKKAVKNASCLQCQHCSKFFVPTIFLPHLNTCLLAPGHQQQLRQQVQGRDRNQIEIRIKQTLVKEAEGKPYTEYVLELNKNGRRWTLHRKYKAFCDLHGALKAALPGVELSDSSYIVNPQQASKKSLLIEERRKVLEKYLQDLESNPFVQHHPIWVQFVEAPESDYPSLSTSPLKQNSSLNKVMEGSKERAGKDQTPEEFFRVWNQRQMRGKESQNVKSKWKLALN